MFLQRSQFFQVALQSCFDLFDRAILDDLSGLGFHLGDIVGHFFSAALLAVVPIVGYRLMYKNIGEKEMTYIFAASWAYLVFSKFLGF